MTAYIGIKSKRFGDDVNSTSGKFTPLYYLEGILPKELTDLDLTYLGDGRSGADHTIWKKEYRKVFDKFMDIVNGEVVEEFGTTLVKSGRDFGDEFGKYFTITYGRD